MVTSPTTSASYALSFSLRTPSAGPKLVTRTMEVGVHCQCTAISERASPMAVTESSRLRLRTGGSTIHTHSATSGCQPHCNLAMGFVIMGRCRRWSLLHSAARRQWRGTRSDDKNLLEHGYTCILFERNKPVPDAEYVRCEPNASLLPL